MDREEYASLPSDAGEAGGEPAEAYFGRDGRCCGSRRVSDENPRTARDANGATFFNRSPEPPNHYVLQPACMRLGIL